MMLETSEQSNAVQILKPVRAVPNVRAQIEAFIEQKISERIGADEAGIFEPFFQTKLIAREIRKLQTIPQRLKWPNYFKEWGCLSCHKKDGQYGGEGMCGTCYQRTRARVRTILRFTEKERPDALLGCPSELAGAAVRTRPSSDIAWQLAPKASSTDEGDALLAAAGIPPLEVETRPYVTKAERMAQQGKATLPALPPWRADCAETLHRAKTLRFEQGLTWKEITRRLDPKGFAIDPERATERVRLAAHNHLPPDVRKLGQARVAQRRQKKSARRKEMWRQARALHAEQNLTWREIAQRLDPDFDKNPKAAIARIEMGAHRVSIMRNLTNLARTSLVQNS